jgi:tRNA acetyltransferase TAN1
MGAACSQLWMNLRAIGDTEPKVNKTKIKGIIKAWTIIDPVEAILKLRKHMSHEPYRYDKIFRVLPIINRVETSLDLIVAEVESQKEKIGKHETFRITVEKRKTELRSMEIIKKVANIIDQKVDLREPDWVVLIEIMGKTTGVSIIHPESILNVQKESYKLSLKTN